MKKRWVSELRPGERVDTVFAVKDIERRRFTSKEGEYLQLTLSDKSGEVRAICWEPAALPGDIAPWDILTIRGTVQKRKDHGVEIIIENGMGAPDDERDPSYFLATTDRDISAMQQSFTDHIQSITDGELREAIAIIEREHRDAIAKMPATLTYHHAYIGGLLEHTLSVVSICRSMLDSYELDADLLTAGALVHKIGKVREYSISVNVTLDRTGGLQGPGVSGFLIVKEAAQRAGLSESLTDKLLHMVLACAKAVKPRFPEAMALTYADYLDAQLHSFTSGYGMAGEGWYHDRKWGFMLK